MAHPPIYKVYHALRSILHLPLVRLTLLHHYAFEGTLAPCLHDSLTSQCAEKPVLVRSAMLACKEVDMGIWKHNPVSAQVNVSDEAMAPANHSTRSALTIMIVNCHFSPGPLGGRP